MSFSRLLSEDHIVTLHRWLRANGELYLHLHHPRSGGTGPSYRVRRLAELRQILADDNWPEVEIWVYRDLKYPIRGTADNKLLKAALKAIPDGAYYEIVSMDSFYPEDCLGADGDSHKQLRDDFDEVRGQEVAIGPHPREGDYMDDHWVYNNPAQVLYVAYRGNDYDRQVNASGAERAAAVALWEKEV